MMNAPGTFAFTEQEQDSRVHKFCFPHQIVTTQGTVMEVSELLTVRPLMIHLRETEVVTFQNRQNSPHAAVLLDFGRELHGGARILTFQTGKCKTPRFLLRFGESVGEALTPVGVKGACNDHSTREMTVTLPMLSDQRFAQTGFRYLYVEFLEEYGEVSIRSIVAESIYLDLPYLGTFRCNDAQLNQIFDTAAYTVHLCMQNRLWDGIKRDRLTWIGDTHPEMLAVCRIFGAHALIEQNLADSSVEYPLPLYMDNMPSYSLWWILILRDYYRYTGDYAMLMRHFPYMQQLTAQLLPLVEPDGTIRFSSYFLDWPTNGTPAAKDGVQALAYLSLQAAHELLIAGNAVELAQETLKTIEKLQSYRELGNDSKAANAMLFLAGLISKADAATKLLQDGAHGLSTFMSYYIFTALSRCGYPEEALRFCRTYYGGMLEMGATTFWEDFSLDWMENSAPITRIANPDERDIHGDFGAYCYTGYRHSLCHGWSAGPVSFLMETVLGVQILEPGAKKIGIFPSLCDLTYATGTYPLPSGVLTVTVEKEKDGKIHLSYQAPDDVEVITDSTFCK